MQPEHCSSFGGSACVEPRSLQPVHMCRHAAGWLAFSPPPRSAMQIVNLLCWIAPNAYLLAVPCRWNGWNENVINAFGALRWTCW